MRSRLSIDKIHKEVKADSLGYYALMAPHLALCSPLMGSSIASDVPFVFSEPSSGIASYTSDQLERMSALSLNQKGVPSVSIPKDDEILTFPVTGGGNTSGDQTEKKVVDLKKTLNSRVEPDNSVVHNEALVLAGKYLGDHTIEQICAIYSHLKNG